MKTPNPPKRTGSRYLAFGLISIALCLALSSFFADIAARALLFGGGFILLIIAAVILNKGNDRPVAGGVTAREFMSKAPRRIVNTVVAFTIMFPLIVFFASTGADLRTPAGRLAKNLGGVLCLFVVAAPFVAYWIDRSPRASKKCGIYFVVAMSLVYVAIYTAFLLAIYVAD